MYNTGIIVSLSGLLVESFIVIAANIFTVFVFWKNHGGLKRPSFLLINLAVADLFVGLTDSIAVGIFYLPQHLGDLSFNSTHAGNSFLSFQISFSFASVFFLTLISLERAYALIWPLRHRVTSSKCYIYGASFAWIITTFAWVLTLLATCNILKFSYWTVAASCVMVICLTTICVSYLMIRKRLSFRVVATDTTHMKQKEAQQNAKLSRTLFIVITASLFFWIPSLIVYTTHHLCFKCVPLLLLYCFDFFRLANSLANPIIYSYRIPMFREMFKRKMLCKQSKRYTVNYMR